MTQGESIKRKTEIGKKAFDLYLAGKCQNDSLIQYASELGITIKTLKANYMSYYKNRVVDPKPTAEEIEQYNLFRCQNVQSQIVSINNGTNKELIDTLLAMKYVPEIINFVNEEEYSIGAIYQQIKSYELYNPENKAEITKLNKIKAVIVDYRNKQGVKKNQDIQKANAEEIRNKAIQTIKRIIEEFLIAETDDLEEVIDRHKEEISYSIFSKYVDALADGTEEEKFLFNRLADKMTADREAFEELTKKIIFNIKNGMLKNDNISRFTILDYYRTTATLPKKFLSKARSLLRSRLISRRDFEMIETFFTSYEPNSYKMSEDEALVYHYARNNQTLNDVERKAVIDYLNSLPVPLLRSTVICAFEEYLKGELTFNINKSV